ncbi:MAG: HTTM domain-containing protein [Granulosicoccus sp.]|nr:HTTM domain-containing protein [Granulosicoccus sp.]
MLTSANLIDRLKTVFSIDLRALAVFRICLSLVILADLYIRAWDLRDFYTDDGVMPRELWGKATHSLFWSFHAASGEPWFQVLLFILAALVALCLLLGYRTRLMTILSWLFLASLINRNHFILQAGDHLLVILTFWAMFLPLNARYSVDSALRAAHRDNPNQPDDTDNRYFSMATVAMILQVLYLYFFTALLKTGTPWRETYEAAFYAVSLEHFATPVGAFMREFPGFLKLATFFVYYLEVVVMFLALSPWFHLPLRIISVVSMYLLHLSFLLMLHIGLFPIIDFTALILLIPTPVWDWLQRRRSRPATEAIRLHYDQDCGFCVKMCLLLREFCLTSKNLILPAQQDAQIGAILERERSWVITDEKGQVYTHASALQLILSQHWFFRPISWLFNIKGLMRLANRCYTWIDSRRPSLSRSFDRWLDYRPIKLRPSLIGQLAAGFFLYAITVLNITGLNTVKIKTPKHVVSATQVSRLSQRWGMFAPVPLRYSLYPAIPGTLRDGTEVDLFKYTMNPPTWDPPAYAYPHYQGYRWRKFNERVDGGGAHTAGAYGSYLCRSWNRRALSKDKELATLEIWSIRQRTTTDGTPRKIEKKKIRNQWCFAEFAPKS